MRITTKGQVTIPADIREKAGFLPRTEVEVTFDGRSVRIVLAERGGTLDRGTDIVEHLRGRGDVPLDTDAILALTRER